MRPVALCILFALPLSGQERDTLVRSPDGDGPFFYHGLTYGSEAYLGPLGEVLNTGYSLAQTDRHSREVLTYEYGFTHVKNSLTHPVRAINRAGGWWDFIRKEMLPLTVDPDDVKWYTNYTGHLIEGGIRSRRLREWYAARGVPLAGLWAGVTNMTAAVLNELYEHPTDTLGTAGTVADLYFFDLAGILLFTSDGVARFFARTLRANVWTGQAAFTYPGGEIHNNGNYLHAKFPWGPIPRTSLFYWSGMGAGLGLTLHRPGGLDVSVAFGRDARRMGVDPETGEESADLSSFSATLFVDRHGSLLASAHLSQVEHRLLKLNVYPGVLPIPGGFGAWAVVSQDFEVRIGVSHRALLGAGFGYGR